MKTWTVFTKKERVIDIKADYIEILEDKMLLFKLSNEGNGEIVYAFKGEEWRFVICEDL